jgi:membrane protein required for colicin V production
VSFPIHSYDFLMLAVLFLSILFGAWKGMAWQLAALASILVSALVAAHFSGPLAPLLSSQVPWNRCIAMLGLYVLTSLAIWVVFRMVAHMIDRVQLKEFDRQLGALFGAAKGLLWCVVITFFAVTLSEPARQTILKTRSGYYIAVMTARATPILPQEVRAVLGKYIEELDRKLDPSTPAGETARRPPRPTQERSFTAVQTTSRTRSPSRELTLAAPSSGPPSHEVCLSRSGMLSRRCEING